MLSDWVCVGVGGYGSKSVSLCNYVLLSVCLCVCVCVCVYVSTPLASSNARAVIKQCPHMASLPANFRHARFPGICARWILIQLINVLVWTLSPFVSHTVTYLVIKALRTTVCLICP